MDILAHGLWSNIALYKKYPGDYQKRLVAVLFGVLPDVIPFVPSVTYLLLNRAQFSFYNALYSQAWVFVWARGVYNFTHSFVIFVLVSVIVMVARKGRIYWPMLAWGLHILMDLFTHPNFFRTPFLFPISTYRVPFGLSWGHPAIMIPQYSFFLVWYAWWFIKSRKLKVIG
ncbi:MAG: hypothetical protein HYZ51_04235 [Candidatus Doudnabacteria bacterium]|nr:hypothetical protein [Candidatus Doudnabacteria bacterium]